MSHFFRDMKSWAAAGMPVVPDAEHTRRFKLCQACPQYKKFQCQMCGCVAIAKAKLATSTCPLGRW